MSTPFEGLSELQSAQRATDASIAALGRMLERVTTSLPLPPITVAQEDKLRGVILEALTWLDANAPGRARDVLTEALKV